MSATIPDLTRAELGWKLGAFMEELVGLEQRIADQVTLGRKPRVYMWKPRQWEFPAIYNWLTIEAPSRQVDTAHTRDFFTIVAAWAMQHTDVDEEMARMTYYIDLFREVVDPALYVKAPMGAKWAQRLGVRLNDVPLGQGVYALAAEFPIQVQLHRQIR